MKAEVLSYVFDFVSILVEDKDILSSIRKIILFGSAVSNELTKNSDIDIFIDSEKEIQEKVNSRIDLFEEIAEKKWSVKGIEYPIKCIIGNLEEKRWTNLHEELIAKSIILYGEYEKLPENLKQKVLIEYNISNLSQKKKVKFLRELAGYHNKKKNKVYVHQGILEKIAGEKLGASVISIPIRNIKVIKDFLSTWKIKYKILNIWVK